MSKTPPKPLAVFAVVDTGTRWRVADLVQKLDWYTGARYREADSERIWSAQQILATFATRLAADEALERAQTLEKQLRPLWQMAVAHELAARNTMTDAVVSMLIRLTPTDTRYRISLIGAVAP